MEANGEKADAGFVDGGVSYADDGVCLSRDREKQRENLVLALLATVLLSCTWYPATCGPKGHGSSGAAA